MIRFLLLFKHLGTEFGRLSHPSRLIPVMFLGRHIPDKAFLSIWMYFFGYTVFYGLGVISLAASGLTFETAVGASAAAISNMGPLLDMTLLKDEFTYKDFAHIQKMISAVFMLVGRVEVLAVLILFTPSFWQK